MNNSKFDASNFMDTVKLAKTVTEAYEKQIAHTILDAQKMHEESYSDVPECGYTRDWGTCFIDAAEKNKLSPNLWYLLNLANHWHNDTQQWAEDMLAGKQIIDQVIKPEDIEENQDVKQSKH